jgi:hypothetical protein
MKEQMDDELRFIKLFAVIMQEIYYLQIEKVQDRE